MPWVSSPVLHCWLLCSRSPPPKWEGVRTSGAVRGVALSVPVLSRGAQQWQPPLLSGRRAPAQRIAHLLKATQHARSPSSVSFPLSVFISLRFSLSLSLLASRQMTDPLNSHVGVRTVVQQPGGHLALALLPDPDSFSPGPATWSQGGARQETRVTLCTQPTAHGPSLSHVLGEHYLFQ